MTTYQTASGSHVAGGLMAIFLAFALSAQASAEGPVDAMDVTVTVDGLVCPFCASGLEKKLRSLDWSQNIRISVDAGKAEFNVKDARKFDVAAIQAAVKDGGFTPRDVTVSVTGRVETKGAASYLVLPSGTRMALANSPELTRLKARLGTKDTSVTIAARVSGDKTTTLVVQTYEVK